MSCYGYICLWCCNSLLRIEEVPFLSVFVCHPSALSNIGEFNADFQIPGRSTLKECSGIISYSIFFKQLILHLLLFQADAQAITDSFSYICNSRAMQNKRVCPYNCLLFQNETRPGSGAGRRPGSFYRRSFSDSVSITSLSIRLNKISAFGIT